jgi:hypothetical protein
VAQYKQRLAETHDRPGVLLIPEWGDKIMAMLDSSGGSGSIVRVVTYLKYAYTVPGFDLQIESEQMSMLGSAWSLDPTFVAHGNSQGPEFKAAGNGLFYIQPGALFKAMATMKGDELASFRRYVYVVQYDIDEYILQ